MKSVLSTSATALLMLSQLASSNPLPPGATFEETPLKVKGRDSIPQEKIKIPNSSNTGPAASKDGNSLAYPIQDPKHPGVPERGSNGASIMGPQNPALQEQNPDFLAPPTTDHGSVPSAKWPFALSHNRVEDGGWARQQTVDQLPSATEIAGVNMRLLPGAIRELHWHSADEWAYIIKGSTTVSTVTPEGQVSIGTTNPGDLWYFPAGTPHILQATDDDPDGSEFLLCFDQGDFDEDSTFLLTDWTAHVPKRILNKNFGFEENSTAFDDIPASELYIFKSPVPAPADVEKVESPFGDVPNPFTYAFSEQKPINATGGWVKIADSTNFKASRNIAAALVHVEPGSLREMHWHPNADEWDYFLNGTMRVGYFAANANSQTIDYQAGDVGYITRNSGTYAECISKEPCEYLEIFKASRYEDVSLNQWMALTPVQVVADHLRVSNETISQFKKEKPLVVKGSPSFT